MAVIATASVVIGQLMGSGADTTSSGAVPAEWNRVVLLDGRNGQVTVVAADGAEVGRINSGLRAPTGSAVAGEAMLITSSDDMAVVDLGRTDEDADDTTSTFGFGAEGVVTPAGSALAMIAPRADGGRGVIVHGPSGDWFDTDSFVPVVGARYEFADARATPSGRNVLVTDSGNFQSVLFSFERDEPSFFPGLALAVADDIVVTAQNVGTDATVNVFAHTGEQLTTAQTPSVRAGMVAGDSIVLVTVDGDVITMDAATGETSDRADLDIGTISSGYVTTSGDRLVVEGADGTAVVDDAAATIGTYPATRVPVPGRPSTGSQCVALVPVAADPEPQLTVVDFVDGNSIVDTVDAGVVAAEAEPTPLVTDASGCTIAIATSSGIQLMTGDGVEFVATDDTLIALTPDASQFVIERSGRLLLLDVSVATTDTAADEGEGEGESESESDEADDTGDGTAPIDVGREGATVHFTEL